MTKDKKSANIAVMTENKVCPFFEKCGGCLYQDLSEHDYLAKKKNFITRAFQDYDVTPPLMPIRSVPLASRRRASFAFTRGKVGYNALKSHQIVEITECRLLKPEIVSFLPTLRGWHLAGQGDIFVLSTDFGLDIHIRTARSTPPDLSLLEQLAEWAKDEHIARLTYNDNPIAEKVHLLFLPDSFLQPSVEGEQILIDLMLSEIGHPKKAVDLFCGSGTFTRPLLTNGIKTIGYDCADSVEMLGVNGIKRDLFRNPLLSEELSDIDLIVLDPPRAGAKAQVEQIAQTNVPKIVMISCSPKTSARDCRILVDAGWQLTKVTPVDQFRWSNHIELVCILEKER